RPSNWRSSLLLSRETPASSKTWAVTKTTFLDNSSNLSRRKTEMKKLLNNIHNVYRDPGCEGFGHSFLLKRKAGNVLIPRMGEDTTIRLEYDAIDSMGGIKIIFITDYHFGGASSEEIAMKFGGDVFSSTIEQPKLKKKGLNKQKTFSYERQFLEPDLETIP